jgi:hypothetical protein
MKEGNADGILGILTDPMLNEKRVLIKKKSYSIFLKKTYNKADLTITNIEYIGPDNSSVDVAIDLKDGGPSLKTRYILIKDNGIWKISEEITNF